MTIEEEALQLYPKKEKQNKKGTGTYDPNFSRRNAYIEGANYVLEQIEQLIYEKHVKDNLPLFYLTYLIDKLMGK